MNEQYNETLGRSPTSLDRAWLSGFVEGSKQSADVNNNPYKTGTPENEHFVKGFDNYIEYYYEN